MVTFFLTLSRNRHLNNNKNIYETHSWVASSMGTRDKRRIFLSKNNWNNFLFYHWTTKRMRFFVIALLCDDDSRSRRGHVIIKIIVRYISLSQQTASVSFYSSHRQVIKKNNQRSRVTQFITAQSLRLVRFMWFVCAVIEKRHICHYKYANKIRREGQQRRSVKTHYLKSLFQK